MIDFTLSIYQELLINILEQGYHFQSFNEFLLSPKDKVVVDYSDYEDNGGYNIHYEESNLNIGPEGMFLKKMSIFEFFLLRLHVL